MTVTGAHILVVNLLTFLLRGAAPPPATIGVQRGALAPCPPTPNCVSTTATDARQRMAPLPFTGPPADAMARLRAIVAGSPRTRIVADSGNYLHAEFRSRIFHFVDDVELLADPAASVVHFRSASRVGRGDLGANRRRMEQIAREFAKGGGRR